MTKKEEKKFDWYWEIWNKKTNKPNEVIAWLIVEKAKLEEENKKLKERIERWEKCFKSDDSIHKMLNA